MLGHKQFKVVFVVKTQSHDLMADTSIINNQAISHSDDVPSKSNVVRTQPTLMYDHEFKSEDGSELPNDVKTLTPASTEDITPGTTVTPNLFTVPDAKPVPKTGDATTTAPVVGGIAAIMTSILAFFGIKRKSDE